jgi:Flp pilus assembly pilin Flp
MVAHSAIRRFVADEDGVTLVEALLVTPIVLFFMTFMVEMTVAAFHWNQTVKAVQVGARLTAVSSPLMTRETYEDFLTSDFGSNTQGGPTPSDALSISCGAGETACDSDLLDRVLTGGDGVCGDGSALVGMCDIAPWLTEDNITVTYSRGGLGYVGRPFGPVSTITLEARDVPFTFMLLDDLMPILSTITHPPHRVSSTSEDLSNCKILC